MNRRSFVGGLLGFLSLGFLVKETGARPVERMDSICPDGLFPPLPVGYQRIATTLTVHCEVDEKHRTVRVWKMTARDVTARCNFLTMTEYETIRKQYMKPYVVGDLRVLPQVLEVDIPKVLGYGTVIWEGEAKQWAS